MAVRNPVFMWTDIVNKQGSFLRAGSPKFQSVRGLGLGLFSLGLVTLDLKT